MLFPSASYIAFRSVVPYLHNLSFLHCIQLKDTCYSSSPFNRLWALSFLAISCSFFSLLSIALKRPQDTQYISNHCRVPLSYFCLSPPHFGRLFSGLSHLNHSINLAILLATEPSTLPLNTHQVIRLHTKICIRNITLQSYNHLILCNGHQFTCHLSILLHRCSFYATMLYFPVSTSQGTSGDRSYSQICPTVC